MVISCPKLAAFERRYQQEVLASVSHADTLARFAALWAHARMLNPEIGTDWQHDLESDLAVARAVNGLPPSA